MARKCRRARYYSPEVLREEFVRSAFETVNWDDTDEVTTLFYLTKDLVQGRRAADELWLEWRDVERVEATATTKAPRPLIYLLFVQVLWWATSRRRSHKLVCRREGAWNWKRMRSGSPSSHWATASCGPASSPAWSKQRSRRAFQQRLQKSPPP